MEVDDDLVDTVTGEILRNITDERFS